MKKIGFLLAFLSTSSLISAQLVATLGYERNKLDDFRFIISTNPSGAPLTTTTYAHQVHYLPTLAVQWEWEGNRYIHRLGFSGLGIGADDAIDSKSQLYKGDIRFLTFKKSKKTRKNTLLLGAFMDASVHRRTTVPKIVQIFESHASQVGIALGLQPEAQFDLSKNTHLIANCSWTIFSFAQKTVFVNNPTLLPRQQNFSSFDFDGLAPVVSLNVGVRYDLFSN